MKELTHPDWARRMNLFGDTTGDAANMIGLDADKMLAVARPPARYVDQYGIAEEP